MEAMKRIYRKPSVKVHGLNMDVAMLAGSDNTIPTGNGGLGGNGGGSGGSGVGWLAKRQGSIIIDDDDEDE